MARQTRRNNLAKPTLVELRTAREVFEAVEPRDLFYRLSLYLMEQAEARRGPFSRAEALAVLLQTWNHSYYQRLGIAFDAAHFAAIEGLLAEHEAALAGFAKRSISSRTDEDEDLVRALYRAFETVLGQTGASKALHLLAPRFFPLWDAAIAEVAYGLYARDDPDYWRLMCATAEQVAAVGGEAALGRNPIKAIDEYNYCRYTLKRIN
ncbi:MAG: hypothetical protein ABSD62_13590 [Candidatus Limnocylindrales bacterium]|jgi:hypothetical protein